MHDNALLSVITKQINMQQQLQLRDEVAAAFFMLILLKPLKNTDFILKGGLRFCQMQRVRSRGLFKNE